MKKKIDTEVNETTNTTNPNFKVTVEPTKISPLELNANTSREDLNELFRKVEDKINEIIKHE